MPLCECGCGEEVANRFVHNHHRRGRRGEDSTNYKGGKVSHHGYIKVLIHEDHPFFSMAVKKSGAHSILEHRLVMAWHLDRPLMDTEVVHHENGRKDDNRIENLRLFHSNSAHTQHHWDRRKEEDDRAYQNTVPDLPSEQGDS